MAKTYRSIYTTNNKFNHSEAYCRFEKKQAHRASRREGKAICLSEVELLERDAPRKVFRTRRSEVGSLLAHRAKWVKGWNLDLPKEPRWDGEVISCEERPTSWEQYQELVQQGCTHIRMCVSYTWGGRPCGEWVGIDPFAKVFTRKAFGLTPSMESRQNAFMVTLYELLKDSGLYGRVMNHKFKTNGSIFAYWACSGKPHVYLPTRDVHWAGDILIKDALLSVESGAACPLNLRGYTVTEVVENIHEIVEDSRAIHALRTLTPSLSKERKEWFSSLERDEEFLSISHEEINKMYSWYAKGSVYLKDSVRVKQVHQLLGFKESSITDDDICEWRKFSGACEEGTREWLSRHKLPSLATLRSLTEAFGAEMALHRYGVMKYDIWFSKIKDFLEK